MTRLTLEIDNPKELKLFYDLLEALDIKVLNREKISTPKWQDTLDFYNGICVNMYYQKN